MCPSSGENTWYLSLYIEDCLVYGAEFIPPCMPDSHLYIQSDKYHVFSPDDGHTVARNMQRKKNKYIEKNCARSWFCLQNYIRMQGQQNIKFCIEIVGASTSWSPKGLSRP
jgi:hypothetical protein